ncbi:putative virion structural protein [Vibrio phage Aphrodite1]|uniref:Putative virion structural protein n=1 Tax=Vibrio phage Aphrodite1 TaxID=2070057 RepID=A0A2I7QHT3_9CAUD|nr:putative virion structural protein [Vibrio phage Aphrodite1]AUR80956.1 putative virion structural protein [Vibrio phage Aphrodite1]
MIPLELSNILDQARLNASAPTAYVYQLTGSFVLPDGFVDIIGIERLSGLGNFVSNRSEDIRVRVRLQPGVYQSKILPFKDDLQFELIMDNGRESQLRYYRCVPLSVNDTEALGNTTKEIDLSLYDSQNFISLDFQLIDLGFSKLRTIPYSDTFLSANVKDVIHYVLSSETIDLGLTGQDRFRGVFIEEPVNNQVVYRQIVFPQGKTNLINIVQFLQENDYGVYSRGVGSYYMNGEWRVYTLWDSVKYDRSDYTLDIIRVPEDVMPSIEHSYYVNDSNLSIVSSGQGELRNSVDVQLQNKGTGQQIISSKAANGMVGSHYEKGQVLLTRQDSLTQFRTVERKSGEERIHVNPVPTNNIARELSKSRVNNGEVLTIPWKNADPRLIRPGMPFRYYYLTSDGVVKQRTGTVIGMAYDFAPKDASPQYSFYCNMNLTLFMGLEEQYV